jgi:hypothetical protein
MAFLSDLKSGVFRTMLLDNTLARLEESGISVRGPASEKPLAEVKFADFSPPVRHKALQMQPVYVSFFCLENAVRELIMQRLAEHHGADWWNLKVPSKIRDAVSKLREKEAKAKYHAQRSESDIGYTTFGHLSQMIVANWDDFSDLFPDQAWITARFSDLEMSRNIIMHTNVLPTIEIERIDSIVRDWLRQVG